MEKFKVIIVEDVKLELKGTEEIFRNEIPDAEIIGTAMNEPQFWELMETQVPDLVLLDLGLGGSTTVGVEICRKLRKEHPAIHVLIFTGETLNEKLWVDVLDAGADGRRMNTAHSTHCRTSTTIIICIALLCLMDIDVALLERKNSDRTSDSTTTPNAMSMNRNVAMGDCWKLMMKLEMNHRTPLADRRLFIPQS